MKKNTLVTLIFFSAIVILYGTRLAHAEKADFSKPTNVEANQMFYDEAKQTNTFIGNVVLTRGTLVMHADKLLVRQDQGGVARPLGRFCHTQTTFVMMAL